jgi:transposase InsO family protein
MPRTYTQAQRDEGLARMATIGSKAAAMELGIPKGTLDYWGHKRRERLAQGESGVSGQISEMAAAPASSVGPEAGRRRSDCEPSAGRDAAESAGGAKRRVARSYTPSQRASILEYAAEHGPTRAAEHFNVSRFSIYEWQRKVQAAARGEGRTPTSGPSAQDIEELRDREILSEWHLHPGLGPSQIRNQLRRKGIKVSVHTVRRVMEEAGYRPPKVSRQPHTERFEAVRPNHMWHLDFLHRHINRASTFTLILLDDCSRFVVGHGVADAERAQLVTDTFEEAVARHGRPEMVLHDKGSAFWSWRGISRFTALLTEMGVDQVVAEHKEWNGKLEVFNANLAKELFDAHHFYDLAEMERRLASHLRWYNHHRTHHALGGLLVPADRYFGRSQEVIALIESGAPSKDLDALDLSRRPLELFKVVSTGGVPELYLMGQKLLSLDPQREPPR